MNDRLFSAVCVLIFALSVAAFLHGDRRERTTDDPRGDLIAFLHRNGAVVGNAKEMPNGEAVMPVSFASCSAPGKLVYVPVIHRITDQARSEWNEGSTPRFVHDRREVPSLSLFDLMPRWLYRRIGVNLQISDEDPWISIAFALVPPDGCRWPDLDWAQISERR